MGVCPITLLATLKASTLQYGRMSYITLLATLKAIALEEVDHTRRTLTSLLQIF